MELIALNQIVRVGLSIIIAKNGKLLMGLRKGTETADGLWAYPGGRMDFGEDPTTGIIREVLEETGLVVKEEDVEFLRYCNEFFPKEQRHYVSLVFFVSKFKGELVTKEKEKCEEWKWFHPDKVPANSFPPCIKNTRLTRIKIILTKNKKR
ncbi:hypothetical protein LCGC14_1740010 [marine sediment metagenome]|uniref:Nudix hydrolase domain-containing protein n=1 Tax=marine sediment metagenome TaxID=412755 RepID=A0A0F9JM93_9ZZZZ